MVQYTKQQQWMLWAVLLAASIAWGQTNKKDPQIGYLYPAGAQQGASVYITVGGQYLRGATDIHVTGEGVQASVVRYFRPLRNLQKEQRELLTARLKEVRDRRIAELSGKSADPSKGKKKPNKKDTDKETEEKPEVKMPEHPLLDDLDNKSLRELAHIREVFFFPRWKTQINRQLSELVQIEIRVNRNALPGDRALRIRTKTGISNPVVFQVGVLPEAKELEPNNQEAYPILPNLPKGVEAPEVTPYDLPVLLNGQIMPGDIDRFRFTARQGQKLVFSLSARCLIPYLADAVPGWFQGTLALYDDQGHEVAFQDDYRFDPDPTLFYEVPKSGEYEVEIRDAIYRGREDFIYRIAMGELPYITHLFPLGGRVGVDTVSEIDGWNLPQNKLRLDTRSGGQAIRQTSLYQKSKASNAVTYAVDTLRGVMETENNDTPAQAQQIKTPRMINGRIDRPGDVDVFAFDGRAGQGLVVDVYARRLNSPMDALVRLTDRTGQVIAWNDDYVEKDKHLHKDSVGLLTHHADAYLMTDLPEQGTYYVHLSDTQNQGGPAYGYRMRVSVARPDFELRVTPSSHFVQAGGVMPLTVYVLRKDGFTGEIRLGLHQAPPGFELKGGRIPPGCDRIRMTLTAPARAPESPIALEIVGLAHVGGSVIRRTAMAADDVMQAFLYRHLVPTQELLVCVQKAKWRVPEVTLAGHSTVRIPAGGSTQVQIKTRRGKALKEMKLVLDDPPTGLSLHDVEALADGLTFRLKAEKDAFPNGYEDNLIIEVMREYYPKDKDGKPQEKKQQYSMGTLPAVPFEIVQ
ncbi:hypothetical protein ACFL6U_14135 [Planctomycetota bacterium]